MKKISFVVALLPLVLFCAGCGTAEYEKRMSASASGAASSSKFTSDLAATETTVPGTTVTLRLPKPMQPADMGDPLHGKFTLFEIPGLKAAYEGFLDYPDQSKVQYCLYVVVTEAGANDLKPLKGWLFGDLPQKFPNPQDSSTEVNPNYSAATPEGSAKQYDEIHYTCKQKFFFPKKDKPQDVQEMDGNLVCLSCSENGQIVTLIFRYPSYLKDHPSASFDADWIKLMAGTLKVGGAGG